MVRQEDRHMVRRIEVLDLLYFGLTILFFVIAVAYVRGCEKLQ